VADSYHQLPADDESPVALLEDAIAQFAAAVAGWVRSDAAPEVALLAALADEGSTLYALLREDADDRFRDFGASILGVPAGDPLPAATTTTWTARNPAPVGGERIEAGTQLVVDAPAGRVAFEVVEDAVLPATETVLAGVTVQALDPGAFANGVTGPVLFDEPLAWVQTVVVDAPAGGGSDGDSPEAHQERVRRAARILSRVPILPRDFEIVAQEIPEVARALVLDNYDADTGLSDQERTVSIFPIQASGADVSAPGMTAVEALVAARREVNWVTRVAAPTRTTIDANITVMARAGADLAIVEALVTAAILDEVLNPARHGQPLTGERLTWQQQDTIRVYEVAAVARVDGVDYVDEVLLSKTGSAPAAANVTLDGPAPLPEPGTITVTVLMPS
jgi:hypothetical protein